MLHTRLVKSEIVAFAIALVAPSMAAQQAAKPVADSAIVAGDSRRAPSFLPLASRQIAQSPEVRARRTARGLASANRANRSWQSPYERFLKPITERHLARARAAKLPPLRASQPEFASVGSSNSLSVNFPGFQIDSLANGNDPADANSTWVSLTTDVNNDGKPDLVTIQKDGVVNVLLNPGTGKFTDFAVTSRNTTAVADLVQDVYATAVDLNNDGYPDLEVIDNANNRVYVYMNNKDGTFKNPVGHNFSFAYGANFYGNGGSVVFADVNGDGIPDMVATVPYAYFPVSGGVRTIVIIKTALGKGDGTFEKSLPEQHYPCNAFLYSNYGQVVAADMNHDGKMDLVYVAGGIDENFNDTSFAAIVLGNGDGTFKAFPTGFPTSGAVLPGVANNAYGSLAVSDVNHDGNPDILFSVGEGDLYVALGLGNGTTQNVETVATGLSTDLITGPQIVNFADVTGDGILDATAYNWGFIAIYKGTGDGKFAARPLGQFVGGEGADQQPMPADFNGDGHVDVVDVNYADARIGFYAGGDWLRAGAPAMAPIRESAQTFQVMATGDFNGDGIPDVLAADFNGVPINQNGGDDPAASYGQPPVSLGVNGTYPNLKVGINDGKGNFTYTTAIASAALFPVGGSWVEPIAADLNKDGKADIILGDFNGLAISLNQGNGVFSSLVQIDLGVNVPCGIAYVDVGDLNGDGYPDIVAAYPGDASCNAYTQVTPSGIFILLNNKKGAFHSKFVPYGYGAYLPKLTDLNGDGKLDLVLADINDAGQEYYLYALPGRGNGSFDLGKATEVLENTVVTAIVPGDYDGDGVQDLVLGVETQIDGNGNPIYNTTGVNLLHGNGDFTFGMAVQYSPGIYPIDGQFADFNGDGRPDLALNMMAFDAYSDIQTSSFVYMANLGGGGFGPAVQTPTPIFAPGSIFVADFNGDGAIDAMLGGWVLDLSGVTGLYLNEGAIQLDLAASPTEVSYGETVTLTAKLKPSISTAKPSGTVTFYEKGHVLGIVEVAGGLAKLTISTLARAQNSITAVYSGDGNFNPATSLPVTVTVK
jgi:hypothetical protein